MQGLVAGNEVKRLEDIHVDFQTALEYGIHELDVTLIRPTNYTDDGYPIKTRIGVIRSNTLTQIGTLVHDLVNEPFFQGVTLNIHKIDEAIEWIPVKEIVQSFKSARSEIHRYARWCTNKPVSLGLWILHRSFCRMESRY